MSTALDQMSYYIRMTLFISIRGDYSCCIPVPVECMQRHDDPDYGVFMVSGIDSAIAVDTDVQRAYNENRVDLLFRGKQVRLVKSLNAGIMLIHPLQSDPD